MGCVEKTSKPRHFLGDRNEFEFTKCLGNFFTPVIYELLEMHRIYEQGIMPFPGAPGDQPYKIIEIFRIMSVWKSDKMKKELEEQKRRSKVKR